MAFIIPKKLGQAAIATGSGTSIYTTPAAMTTLVKCADICNTTSGTSTVSVHLVPSGGAAAVGNALLYNVPIYGNSTVQWTGTQVLDAGGFILAVANGVGLTINIAGGEYSD